MASKRISRLVKILSGAVADAEDEIFQLEGRLERFAHFWALVCKSFIRNRCPIRAVGAVLFLAAGAHPVAGRRHQRHQQPAQEGGRGQNL